VKNIYLIGFRCTGKTAVGTALAGRLGRDFIDADVYLESKYDKTVAEIFAEGGEPLFRDYESESLAELCAMDDLVVGAGGGAVLRDGNVRMMKQSGKCVLLVASAETIVKRMTADEKTESQRPALTDKADMMSEVVHLLAYRQPFYEHAKDFEVSTEKLDVEQSAREIENWLKLAQ
jgi:shikimate kinase